MNKGKLLLIVSSLTLLFASIWVYFRELSTRKSREIDSSPVKAKLSGFELYRYKNDELKSRVSGKKAKLLDPSEVLCEERVIAVRIKDGVREQVEADTAKLTFTGDSFFSGRESTLDTAELTGGVEYLTNKSRFVTEWMRYTEKSGEAFSDRPVRIDSDDQFIAADGGMTYNLKDESIRLRGGVFGSLRSDKLRAQVDGEKKK